MHRLKILLGTVLVFVSVFSALPATGEACGRRAPCSLRAASVGSTTVDLTWRAPRDVRRFGSYAVMRREPGAATYQKVATVSPSSTTTYTDTGLAPSSNYHYTVWQADPSGQFLASSNELGVNTLAADGSDPTPTTSVDPSPTTTAPIPTTSTTSPTTTTAPSTTTTTAAPTTTTTAPSSSTPPPSTVPLARTFTGPTSMPGFTVPAGERWRFDPNVSTTVEVSANVVVRGVLEMRPASPGVVHALRFVGINEQSFVGGGDDPIASDTGLWVMGNGQIDAVGSPKTSWLRASGGLAAGSSTIALPTAPVGWQPGDEILVTPTAAPTVARHYETDEVRTLGSLSGGTLNLTSGLAFAHPAVPVAPTKTMTAEVANLTRNARIEGTPGGRTHVFIRSNRTQLMKDVALRHMGPRKFNGRVDAFGPVSDLVLGRYGLHLHKALAGTAGTLIESVVLRDVGSHGYVPHTSSGVTFRNSVGYNIAGNGFWWDDVDRNAPDFNPNFVIPIPTDGLLVEGNLIGRITPIPEYEGVQAHAYLAGSGIGNVMRNNVAFGVQGNVNSSGYQWREADGDAGVWVFEDNVAHNNKVDGVWIWQVTKTVHTLVRTIAYHNGNTGIFSGAYATNYHFIGGMLYGNGGQIDSTQFLAFAPSAGATERQRITGLRIDAAGLTKAALTLTGNSVAGSPGGAESGLVTSNVFRGYAEEAVRVTFEFHDFGPYPVMWQLLGNDYGPGRAIWFTNDVNQYLAVEMFDLGGPFLLRRADWADGTYVPEWNAKKSTT